MTLSFTSLFRITWWTWAGLLALWLLPIVGQATSVPVTGSTPAAALAVALNADGTLRSGTYGSFNAHGYRFSLTSNGRPQFHPTSTLGAGDEKWQAGFGLNGTNDEVKSLVRVPTGEVYAGGKFTVAGTAPATRIAKWDGTNWNALGAGIGIDPSLTTSASSDVVNAIAIDGAGNIYAGGYFKTAGGITVNNIAKWDGKNWIALGTGLNYTVHALAIDGSGTLYAGGSFTQAGGSAVSNIAKWNGAQWSALGTGVYYPVRTLAISQAGTLYAAGAGPSGGAYIVQWNGATWSELGSGLGVGYTSEVDALAVDATGNVYAGGVFDIAGGVAVNNVAKWDGNKWSALGTGITKHVYALSLDGAGNFYAVGSDQGNRVLKWNGTQWIVVASTNSLINTLAADGAGSVFTGGTFITANSLNANFVAKWDGTSWSNLGKGLDDGVAAVAVDGAGNIYIGGAFEAVGGLAARHIAKWDGTRWTALDAGLNSFVYALAVDETGNVYAGGEFSQAGNTPAVGIAKWDGTRWSALAEGITQAYYSGEVYALTTDRAGNVYAGGRFNKAGKVTVGGVAKWDGQNWSALGSGTGFDYPVYALLFDGMGTLYAGGAFNMVGNVATKYVAKWNGTLWSALATGAPGYVYALAIDKFGTLHAGGLGVTAASQTYGFISAWKNATWNTLPNCSGAVSALAFDGDGMLYVGGSFAMAGAVAAKNIAKWDGTRWAALGTGLTYPVVALALRGRSPLCVAGKFDAVGDRSLITAYFGLYNTGAAPLPLATITSLPATSIQLFPNLSHNSFIISNLTGSSSLQIKLLNSQGQLVRYVALTAPQTEIDTRELAPGLYILQTMTNGQTASQRLVIK